MKAATNIHVVPRLTIRSAKLSIHPPLPWRSLRQQLFAESPTPLINILVNKSTTYVLAFKICKSLHHHTIQIKQPTRCNKFSSLLLEVYVQLNMFRASSRLSSVAQ